MLPILLGLKEMPGLLLLAAIGGATLAALVFVFGTHGLTQGLGKLFGSIMSRDYADDPQPEGVVTDEVTPAASAFAVNPAHVVVLSPPPPASRRGWTQDEWQRMLREEGGFNE